MRVALDARSLQQDPLGGVGRATARILPLLTPFVDIHLLTAAERPAPETPLPVDPLVTPWPKVATAWMQWSAPRWLGRGYDGIFHSPLYGLPFVQPVPMVVTLHDLSFERHPEWFGRGRRLAYAAQARWAARTARAVITVSHYVADDLMRTYGVRGERIFVARHGVDGLFRDDRDNTAVRTRLGIDEQYVVAIGGGPRRNVHVAVEAWQLTRAQIPLDLVVVGTDQPPFGLGIAGGRLPDEDWADLLAGAAALLYPTAEEGFGLPALEAAASGTPVVCARVGALPEVLGDAAVWCDAITAEAFAAALMALLSDPIRAADVREAGLARVAAWSSWQEAADAHLAAYTRATR